MDRHQAAKRLRKAEAELQRAQRHHDGSLVSVERLREAYREHQIATAVAVLLLEESE
jgi:hypothetical protein